MKKIMVLVLFLVFTSVAFADNWYVALTGDDSDGLTWATAYNTIGQAVTASANGDTVYIGAGTYDETVTLSKRLHLEGAGKYDTIIQPTTGHAVTITAARSEVHSLSAIGESGMAEKVGIGVDANDCLINNCYAFGGWDGIAIWSGYRLTLLNSYCKSEFDGANLSYGGHLVENCTFETTGDNSPVSSALLMGLGTSIIRNCIFIATCDTSGYTIQGLQVYGVCSVENCSFQLTHTGTGSPTSRGIILAGGPSVITVDNTTISGSSTNGTFNGITGLAAVGGYSVDAAIANCSIDGSAPTYRSIYNDYSFLEYSQLYIVDCYYDKTKTSGPITEASRPHRRRYDGRFSYRR